MSWDNDLVDRFGTPIALFLIFAGIIALIVWAGIYDSKQWERYAAAHHCVAIGTKAPSNGLGLDGKAVFIPAQTIYRCDGGEEIIR